MPGEQDTANTTNRSGAAQPQAAKRFQSEIEFPYADLESAVGLASTVHARAGTACEAQELAAWMNQSVLGGTFRARLSAARLFGLIERAQGRVTLTSLGRQILDQGSERAARVDAFLKVPLFGAMYEQNRGNVLPPAAAVERQMLGLGVSPKQTERARQTFTKSAQYAGFIDSTTGRFIKPGNTGANAPREEGTKLESEGDKKDKGGGNGGGGDDLPPGTDPIIAGLLKRLPKAGEQWPKAQRKLWLQLLEGSFELIYKDEPSTTGSN